MGTEMQTQSCVICGHSVSRLWLKDCPDYYLGIPYRFDYAECEHCAMVQQVAMPKDTSHFYEAYPVHKSKGKTFALFRSLLIRNVYFFANTIAASIVNVVTGQPRNLAFLALLPVPRLIAAMFPSGTTTFMLRRI